MWQDTMYLHTKKIGLKQDRGVLRVPCNQLTWNPTRIGVVDRIERHATRKYVCINEGRNLKFEMTPTTHKLVRQSQLEGKHGKVEKYTQFADSPVLKDGATYCVQSLEHR